jgi:hypothetical protein
LGVGLSSFSPVAAAGDEDADGCDGWARSATGCGVVAVDSQEAASAPDSIATMGIHDPMIRSGLMTRIRSPSPAASLGLVD